MTRLLVGLLLALNILLFLYGYLGMDSPGEKTDRQREPDFGSIGLLEARLVDAAAEKTVLPTDHGEASEARAEAATIFDHDVSEALSVVEETSEAVEPEEQPAEVAGAGDGEENDATVGGDGEPVDATAREDFVAQEADETEPLLYCGRVGPFKSRVRARRARRSLGLPNGVSIEKKPVLVDKAHWVLIPPLPDRREAQDLVRRLKDRGIEDLWLIPKGALKNAISLGLYSRREAAYAHAENIRKNGFEVEVRPKQEEQDRYWLVFSELTEEAVGHLDTASLPGDVEVEKKVCAQASATP